MKTKLFVIVLVGTLITPCLSMFFGEYFDKFMGWFRRTSDKSDNTEPLLLTKSEIDQESTINMGPDINICSCDDSILGVEDLETGIKVFSFHECKERCEMWEEDYKKSDANEDIWNRMTEIKKLDWNEFICRVPQLKENTYRLKPTEIAVYDINVFKSESASAVPVHPLSLIWKSNERLIGLMPCAKASEGNNILIVKIERSSSEAAYSTKLIAALMDMTTDKIKKYVHVNKELSTDFLRDSSVAGAEQYYQFLIHHENTRQLYDHLIPQIESYLSGTQVIPQIESQSDIPKAPKK